LLRPLTNGEKKVQAQGASVGEVIEHLEGQFPGIKARLMSGEDLHRFVNIYVNEEDIRFSDGLKTATRAGDSLTVLPAVAGG
jgi:molybdopterin converting factor small subunit